MKKIIVLCLMSALTVSAAFAMPTGVLPYGPDAKYAAMGGAGASLVDDQSSAYYNPAGMVRAQALAIKIGAGTASNGSDQLVNTLSNISDPSKFLVDNYSKKIDLDGNLNAIVGLDIAKIGLTVIPVGHLNLMKNANTLSGSITGKVNSDSALTFGRSISVRFLGNINVGVSAKYIYNVNGGAVGVEGATTTTITNTVNTYSGMGFDLGLQGSVNVTPALPVSYAVVYKDIAANVSGTSAVTKTTYSNHTGNQVGNTTTMPDNPLADVVPSTIVIGASTRVPVIGTRVSVDLDSVGGNAQYSVTHIGVEYPVLMGLINLRAGRISGGNGIDMFTYGVGILKDTINIAMITDNNNSMNNQTIADIHLGF